MQKVGELDRENIYDNFCIILYEDYDYPDRNLYSEITAFPTPDPDSIKRIIDDIVPEEPKNTDMKKKLDDFLDNWFKCVQMNTIIDLDNLSNRLPVGFDLSGEGFSPNYDLTLNLPYTVTYRYIRQLPSPNLLAERDNLTGIELDIDGDVIMLVDVETGRDVYLFMDRDMNIYSEIQ